VTTELERRRSLLLQGGGPELSESLTSSTDPADFLIFNVQTDNVGDSEDDEFILPLQSGQPYNFELTYDGKTSIVTGNQDVLLKFPSGAGNYDIKISGIFSGTRFNNIADSLKILDIVQWGAPVWRTFERAFFGCANLVGTYTDTPNFSNVSEFINGLRDCVLWTGTMDDWDMSEAIRIQAFLRNCEAFNKAVNSWDLAKLENMQSLFQDTTIFNQAINSWAAPNLITLRQTFKSALAWNQDFSHLIVATVTDMLECVRLAGAYVQSMGDGVISGAVAPWGTNMHNGTDIGTTNLDDIYVKFNDQTHPSNLTFHGGFAKFTSVGPAKDARDDLIFIDNWAILDGGPTA